MNKYSGCKKVKMILDPDPKKIRIEKCSLPKHHEKECDFSADDRR